MDLAASKLVDALSNFPVLPNVFNPWRDFDAQHDYSPKSPEIRRYHLEKYLGERVGRAQFIFIAEAGGYRGQKFSGIAMTDERLLLGYRDCSRYSANSIFSGEKHRTSSLQSGKEAGMCEITTSVVHGFISDHGLKSHDIVLWNTFAFHPHTPGNLMSNRTPLPDEIESCMSLHELFFSIFPAKKVIAVGNKAHELLVQHGIDSTKVRHPANGGAFKFCEEAANALGVKKVDRNLSLFD